MRAQDQIMLLDMLASTTDVPQHNLHRAEIGAVVECYADAAAAYDVEFVPQDGYTYALITLRVAQLIALCVKPRHDAPDLVPAMG